MALLLKIISDNIIPDTVATVRVAQRIKLFSSKINQGIPGAGKIRLIIAIHMTSIIPADIHPNGASCKVLFTFKASQSLFSRFRFIFLRIPSRATKTKIITIAREDNPVSKQNIS